MMLQVSCVSIVLEGIFWPCSIALESKVYCNEQQSLESTAQLLLYFSNDTLERQILQLITNLWQSLGIRKHLNFDSTPWSFFVFVPLVKKINKKRKLCQRLYSDKHYKSRCRRMICWIRFEFIKAMGPFHPCKKPSCPP